MVSWFCRVNGSVRQSGMVLSVLNNGFNMWMSLDDASLCLVWTERGHLDCQPHLWVFKPDWHLTPLIMCLAFLSYLAAAGLSLSPFLSFTGCHTPISVLSAQPPGELAR